MCSYVCACVHACVCMSVCDCAWCVALCIPLSVSGCPLCVCDVWVSMSTFYVHLCVTARVCAACVCVWVDLCVGLCAEPGADSKCVVGLRGVGAVSGAPGVQPGCVLSV